MLILMNHHIQFAEKNILRVLNLMVLGKSSNIYACHSDNDYCNCIQKGKITPDKYTELEVFHLQLQNILVF